MRHGGKVHAGGTARSEAGCPWRIALAPSDLGLWREGDSGDECGWRGGDTWLGRRAGFGHLRGHRGLGVSRQGKGTGREGLGELALEGAGGPRQRSVRTVPAVPSTTVPITDEPSVSLVPESSGIQLGRLGATGAALLAARAAQAGCGGRPDHRPRRAGRADGRRIWGTACRASGLGLLTGQCRSRSAGGRSHTPHCHLPRPFVSHHAKRGPQGWAVSGP